MTTLLTAFRLVMPLIIFTLLTFGAAGLTKRSFGHVLPPVMCAVSLILYIGQYLFGTFTVSFALIFILTGVSLIVTVLMCRKDKENKNNIFTVGFVAFIVMFFVACFTLLGKQFLDWDEYTHWGIMVKETLRLDRFHCVPESRQLWHKDYPPFSCLNEFFWTALTGYSEGKVTIAMQVFTLSFFVPSVCERITGRNGLSKKDIIPAFLISLSVLVSVLMLEYSVDLWDQKIINSILPDVLMSFMFCYLCIKAAEWDGKDVLSMVSFGIVSASLVLVKQVGIAFIMVALLMLFIRELIVLKEKNALKNIWKYILVDCALLAIPLAFTASWSAYKSRFISDDDFSYMNGQFNLRRIDMGEYLDAVTGKTTGILRDTFADFIDAIFTKKINNVPFLPLTYASMFILCIAIIIIAVAFLRKLDRKTGIMIGISFLVGTLGYAFMMSILYLFCFPDNEKEVLAGFTRYMDSYVLGELLVLFGLLLPLLLKGIDNRKGAVILVSAALMASIILNSVNLSNILPQRGKENPYSMYRNYAGEIARVVPEDSKVFIVYDKAISTHPQWWSPMQLFVQYYINQVDICENYPGSYAVDYSDAGNKRLIVEELAKNDYLYVINTCDGFNEGLREFNGNMDFEENSFYKITPLSDGTVSLEKVG